MLWLIVCVVAAYLIGSIPFGLFVVRWATGEDVRQHGSGRTGGTNAWRAGGRSAGLLTTLLDALKAAGSVWLAQAVIPAESGLNALGMALAGLAAVLGHNHSIFLGFKGGAGGAPSVGAMFALWPWSLFIVVPLGVFVWLGVGYASLATLTVGFGAALVFLVRGLWFDAPIEFVVYGVGVIGLLAWALRPNIQRLMRGEEKRFNWRTAGKAKEQPKA